MTDVTVEEALQSFGLSPKDIKVYIACLELGTSTANDIANKAAINRSTTYDILKSFIERGIASRVIRKKTAHFEVASPERLISLLEERKTKLVSVLDQLKLIKERVVNKPAVEVYAGHEGVKTILEDILLTKEQTDVISTSRIFEVLLYYFPHYIKRRKEAGIFARVLQEASLDTRKLKKRDKEEKRKTKELKDFNINSVTFIYGEKIAMIRLVKNELIGVLISDKSLADDNRSIFEILWRNAK